MIYFNSLLRREVAIQARVAIAVLAVCRVLNPCACNVGTRVAARNLNSLEPNTICPSHRSYECGIRLPVSGGRNMVVQFFEVNTQCVAQDLDHRQGLCLGSGRVFDVQDTLIDTFVFERASGFLTRKADRDAIDIVLV